VRQAPAIRTLLTAILLAVPLASVTTAAADPIESKRAEAQSVLAQIQEIDGQLSHAIEAYNHANVKLDRIRGELQTNARHLKIARRSLTNAQAHLSDRLVALYTGGGDGGTLEVMLGAQSLEDLLNRLDAVERVSAQDARVLAEVKSFRAAVISRKARLERAQRSQVQVVADKAAQRESIEGQLAERQRLLSSIRDQIESLEAAERRRQERLAAQARARFAAAQRQAQAAPAEEEPQALSQPQSQSLPTEDAPAAAPAPDARYCGVVGIAMQYLGVPYRWGGADPSGFDCSGFSMYVFAKVGVSLPHHAATQYGMGVAVSKAELQPGDLVFFNGLGHMGIYIGGGQFIHAPRTGDVVKISSLSQDWYARTWVGARRIV
jgi:peptidoglycan DL-endopeptidase CwlO